MKQSRFWLLAVLSVLTLMATSTLALAELSGSVEVGATVVDQKDNPARVNEYAEYRTDDGVNFASGVELEYDQNGVLIGVESDVVGPHDQQHGLELDIKRMLRIYSDYSVSEHIKDHETLDQMGATARDDTGGGQPSVITDKIIADLIDAGLNPVVGGAQIDSVYDPKAAYLQELSNDYLVTRKELENEASLTIPALPNVTFHAGMRIETREGMEQAIGITKCDACHVTAVGKNIDEKTEEYTFGATGKFGLLTVDYEYMNREFNEDSVTPTRYYEDAQNGTAYNMLYEAADLPLNRTPDSEKDSHSLKARVDVSDTSISASYVMADVESNKADTQGDYQLQQGDDLTVEFESYGVKVATKLGDKLRVSLRGSAQEFEVDDNSIYYPGREKVADGGLVPDANVLPFGTTDAYHSAEVREETKLGLDVVYRLAKGATARLGYEYEDVDREEDELGDTETHSVKAALKGRLSKDLSGRFSYEYQSIDEPFAGALVGIAQGDPAATEDPLGSGLWFYQTADFLDPTGKTWYWNSVYPNRQLESGNQPEDVHEVKFASTWSASPKFAATVNARVRMEENSSVDYEQTTYVPGVNFWYAPNSNLNLSLAYTFSKQETENKMCVGWYHG